MGTTVDKLNYLIGTKTAIRDAIVAKGVNVADDDTFRSYSDKIMDIHGVSDTPMDNDLTFHDYDGTILYSYNVDQALALTELPPLPQHSGLIAQNWSLTLEEIQERLNIYGMCTVGAYYITDDGRTRLYINVTNLSFRTITLFIGYDSGRFEYEIDWGDGTEPETVTGNDFTELYHSFRETGSYCISIKRISGTLCLSDWSSTAVNVMGWSSSGMWGLKKVELGEGVQFGYHPFTNCYVLETVTFPKGFEPDLSVDSFQNCRSLKFVCANNRSLKGSAFHGCTSLKYTALATYDLGTSSSYSEKFLNCYNLQKMLYLVRGYDDVSDSSFENCTSLKSVGFNGTLIKNYAFQNCVSLEKAVLPNVQELYNNCFYNCHSLTSVRLDNVTTIGRYAFYGCGNMQLFDFTRAQVVPTLSNADAFTGISPLCKIYVPSALLAAWKSAAQWNLVSSFITPDIDVVECTSLSLEAEDISGNSSVAKATFTAIVNGYHPLTGEYIEGATYVDYLEISVPKNPSQTEPIEREISYEFYGVTASTTIQQSPYVDYKIVCKYNVNSTSSPTTLISSDYTNFSANFTSMFIDGVEYEPAMTHLFETTGDHEVIFKISDDVITISSFYRLFSGITALTEADFSMVDMSAATSTSSSSGTAYMFYGCTGLKTIILPSTVAYLGYYMFRNCVNVTNLTIKKATAPTLDSNRTWGYSSEYLGYSNRSNGTNMFYVPTGATGYDSGYWTSYLQNTSYCGFTKVESDEL